ncbi:MAG: hypothetical protein U1E23_08800 [Reyranellaceae bacterium]
MYGAHDVLLCIEQGAHIDDPNCRLTPEHYFKSAAEMSCSPIARGLRQLFE